MDSSCYGDDTLTVEEKRAISECKGELIQHEIVITYDHYSADQILAAVLPKGIEVTTSFETIGHIAHMNLKECHFPFRVVIGKKTLLTFYGIIERWTAIPQSHCEGGLRIFPSWKPGV